MIFNKKYPVLNRSKKSRKRVFLVILLAFMFAIWLNNTNLFVKKNADTYVFLAHRGMAQTFDESKVGMETNTAAVIDKPEHSYLENTLASIQAAFDKGAQAVEFDVRLSKDGHLVLFHDNNLKYRTNVTGEIQDYTLSELKKVDIGYGYTADNGKTYPFRGKGVGLMPSLDEVLQKFPKKEFLIEVKDGKMETYEAVWKKLSQLTEQERKLLTIFCSNDKGADYLRKQSKTLRLSSKNRMKRALALYEVSGFTGYLPDDIKNTELRIPLKYASFLWGWPNKFMERMRSVNTKVELILGNGSKSEGFDSLTDLKQIPKGYDGYVWTNKIDKVGDR
ncbi:glycerophosphodiester phosphodiesterase family protein [Streptococcus dentiloxodontae]